MLVAWLLAGCQPDGRRLVVVELGESVADQIISVEVFVLRVVGGVSIDSGVDAASDADGDQRRRPETCRELLSLSDELDFPEAEAQVALTAEERAQLGLIGDGRVLVLARGRDADCRLYQSCREVEISPGDQSEVRIELNEPFVPATTCPSAHRCEAGRCRPCNGCCDDVECSDTFPSTTDVCQEGRCQVAHDLDGDGFPAPEDCDDRLREVHPGAFTACGYDLDHDCDGQIDDLDGCNAPACWLSGWGEVERYPELRAQALAPFGGLVAAALHGGPSGTRFWLGTLSEGHLAEVGSVALEGVEGGLRPQDLVIYRQTAFILTSDTQGVAVVDLSSPSAPVHLGSIDLDQSRLSQSISISPPILWISRFDGVDVWDISRVGLDRGWPELVAERLNLASEGGVSYTVAIRNGLGIGVNGSSGIRCFPMSSPADFSPEVTSCFQAESVTDHRQLARGLFTSAFVTAEGEVFANSRRFGSGDEGSPPGIWKIPFDEMGNVDGEVRTAIVAGDPRAIIVAGGTIIRSSSRGLSLHPRVGFDTIPGVEVDFDDDPENNSPNVLEALLFGTTAVVAVDGVGLVTLELSCRE
jgi:hypothetical protein